MLHNVLIIDDLFGRNVPGGRNPDRENLCAHFLWQDITGDAAASSSRQKVLKPTAQAVFCRGQIPSESRFGVIVENDLTGSLAMVRQGWTQAMANGAPPWAMLLLDLCFYTGLVTEESNRRTPWMPEGRSEDDAPRSYFGLTLLDVIHREFPELPIMILSSKPRDEVSLEFSRRGALGFIDRSDLRGPELLQEAIWQHGLIPDTTGEIVGNSLPLLLALREARRASRHRENVLIRGARGSGKELMAQYIHHAAAAKKGLADRPFVAVNSAVFTPNLFASELFGIEPKTATGVDGKTGLIEAADKGDLFLDEIADMPPEVQAALLRVLQERQVTPVGARKPKKVDVRFLSATNADLEDEKRSFRPDLLDRLRIGGTLWLPPLRERKSDIPLLAEKFVREAESIRKDAMRHEITSEALELLNFSDWPGNIRDLRSCLFDAVNRHPDVEHLVPDHIRLLSAGKSTASGLTKNEVPATVRRHSFGIAALLDFEGNIAFEQQDIGQWSGRLADVQDAHSRLLALYLEAALEATKRRTPEHPQGLIQIHPALKLITGDTSLTASKAADFIKRLLGPLEHELEGDLQEALAIAVRLRPRSSKTSFKKAR